MVGLFESEDAADRFIRQYAEQYGLDDASHLEKYRADLSYEGQGPVLDDEESERSDTQESEQLDFDGFQSRDS